MDTAKPARKQWIDMARGLCMMAILFFHTEMYYAGHDIIPYVVYVENALIIFFFLSGYISSSPPCWPCPSICFTTHRFHCRH